MTLDSALQDHMAYAYYKAYYNALAILKNKIYELYYLTRNSEIESWSPTIVLNTELWNTFIAVESFMSFQSYLFLLYSLLELLSGLSRDLSCTCVFVCVLYLGAEWLFQVAYRRAGMLSWQY